MIPFLQALGVPPGKLYYFLRGVLTEFWIFSPILTRIRIPIECKLFHFQHRERFLFLLFIIDVDENTFEVVVGHWVVQGVKHDTEIEQAITTAEGVLKADMDIRDYKSQILFHYFRQATDITICKIRLQDSYVSLWLPYDAYAVLLFSSFSY